MPTLRILTNAQVFPEDRPGLLAQASRTVAEMLGKPESYVMVILEDGRDMLFAGTRAPAAYLELKSLGLAETRTAAYSRPVRPARDGPGHPRRTGLHRVHRPACPPVRLERRDLLGADDAGDDPQDLQLLMAQVDGLHGRIGRLQADPVGLDIEALEGDALAVDP
jgi:phenylpyruvate tautomerase PptA (4-oxalocrotonate tautomerase family)